MNRLVIRLNVLLLQSLSIIAKYNDNGNKYIRLVVNNPKNISLFERNMTPGLFNVVLVVVFVLDTVVSLNLPENVFFVVLCYYNHSTFLHLVNPTDGFDIVVVTIGAHDKF